MYACFVIHLQFDLPIHVALDVSCPKKQHCSKYDIEQSIGAEYTMFDNILPRFKKKKKLLFQLSRM